MLEYSFHICLDLFSVNTEKKISLTFYSIIYEVVGCVVVKQLSTWTAKLVSKVQIPGLSVTFTFTEMPLERHESVSSYSDYKLNSKGRMSLSIVGWQLV